MAKYLDQNGAQRLVDNLKTSQSALNTKINGEIVARENFATDATSSISALDTKIDNATADMIQTIAVDGTTLSITSGAGTTDTYQVQDTTYDIATTTNAGLMSASDKAKLNNLASITSAGANITISGGTISAAGFNYTLPTANATQKGGVKIGDGLAMDGETLSANVMTGATSIVGGASGMVPAPQAGDENKFLRGDGTWATVSSGSPAILLSVPMQNGSLTYNGAEQSPSWSNYDSEQFLIGGTTAATDAGTYTATFTPQGLCTWKDGTSSAKQVTWTIAKAAVNLSANITGAIAFGSTGTIAISGNAGGGTVTATSHSKHDD